MPDHKKKCSFCEEISLIEERILFVIKTNLELSHKIIELNIKKELKKLQRVIQE